MKYLPLLLLLAGCPDASAPATTQPIAAHATQAIKDWKAHGLYWPRIENCSPYIVELVPVPQDDLQALCGLDAQLYACLDGNTIYIDEDIMNTVRADYVIEHELRHELGGCAYGDVDGNHTRDAYWFPYRGQDIRQ